MSDLERAKTGDILVRDGVEWVVIGFYDEPCVLLQRNDLPTIVPVSERTDVAVVARSEWAKQWRIKK